MAIDINQEKDRVFSSQDLYDILNMSMQKATQNSFINTFILDRAIYLYAIAIAYPEEREEIISNVNKDMLAAWDEVVDNGTLEQFVNDFPGEIELINDIATDWFDQYSRFIYSARNLLDNISNLADNLVGSAASQFNRSMEESGAEEILRIADEWGMNNVPPQQNLNVSDMDEDSLLV